MTLPRSLEPELLDEEGHDVDELAESLVQVAQVNSWLGGDRSLRRHLARLPSRVMPEHTPRTRAIRVLDVGTGNGETLVRLLRWAGRFDERWTGVGVDRSAATVRIAADRGTPVVQADGLALPFPDCSFDAVFCCLTLHHFDDDGARALLREMGRVARSLVLVSDLERSRLHYGGARVLAETLWRGNRLTRADGPHSVLRAFTRHEMEALGRSAGLSEVRVERFLPWRLLLSAAP